MGDYNKEKWFKAMNQKIKFMYSNFVWILLDLSDNVLTIERKWVYKRKK